MISSDFFVKAETQDDGSTTRCQICSAALHRKHLPFRLEPFHHKFLHSIHDPHQLYTQNSAPPTTPPRRKTHLILTIRRSPAPDPLIIDLSLERRIRPFVEGRGQDGNDVFVRHEDDWLKRLVRSGPGEEVAVGVYHLVVEGLVATQRPMSEDGRYRRGERTLVGTQIEGTLRIRGAASIGRLLQRVPCHRTKQPSNETQMSDTYHEGGGDVRQSERLARDDLSRVRCSFLIHAKTSISKKVYTRLQDSLTHPGPFPNALG